jgi:CHASE2 domain-containing sensor protein
MSAVGTDPKPEETNPQKAPGVFSPIRDLASAKRAAKEGSVGGFVFAGMYVLGAFLKYRAEPLPQEETIVLVAVYGALTALIVFLTWRVRSGRGFMSAGLLLLWFVAESALKVLGGSVHVGWAFFYLMVAGALVQGLRGCWKVRRYRQMQVVETFT